MEEALDEVSVPAEHSTDTGLPLFGITVQAGLPTPAESSEPVLEDVENILVTKPESTFFIRMKGETLKDYGIFDGDILVTDRLRWEGKTLLLVAPPYGKDGKREYLILEAKELVEDG